MFVADNDGYFYGEFVHVDESINRLWLRLYAEGDERVYGGGEQFSDFNMRGKNFPIWIQEQVGPGCSFAQGISPA